ncbi:hypothetical protein HNQ38_002590 [Desulfovibrio intestinalis]|uniref:Uncharacterized protein n=1 Tax=Desulfovibrio intestinalis TaxID=58621 RepID=A0A7W8C2M8_9BACT|nr:hypothetical protein [Desulfovibrio intestinalis]
MRIWQDSVILRVCSPKMYVALALVLTGRKIAELYLWQPLPVREQERDDELQLRLCGEGFAAPHIIFFGGFAAESAFL